MVGGLLCSQVLEFLSDYTDGELPADTRAKVEEHLRGCDACTRFGGEFIATIALLREQLLAGANDPQRLRSRLRATLREG